MESHQFCITLNNMEEKMIVPKIGIMPTVSWRSDTVHKVVSSLRGQLDELRIYAGDCDIDIDESDYGWVTIYTGPNVGVRGRWIPVPHDTAYVICVDDDILYPQNYVSSLIDGLTIYPKSVVGYHARIFKPNPAFYFEDSSLYHFSDKLKHDTSVHILGTGTMAYLSDDVSLNLIDFPYPNLGDLTVGVILESLRIRRVALAREKDWLVPIDTSIDRSVWNDRLKYVNERTNLLRTNSWSTPAPL